MKSLLKIKSDALHVSLTATRRHTTALLATLSTLAPIGGAAVVVGSMSGCETTEAIKPAPKQVDLYTPEQWVAMNNIKLEVPIGNGLAIVKCVPTASPQGSYMLKVDILLSKAGIKAMADKIASRSPYTAEDLIAAVNLQKPQALGQGYMAKATYILDRPEDLIPTTSLTPNPSSKELNFNNLQSPGTKFNVTIGLDLPDEIAFKLQAEGNYKTNYQEFIVVPITLGQ